MNEKRLQLSAILPETIYQDLKQIAKDDLISTAGLVRQILANYVKNRKLKSMENKYEIS
jgi:hypothetical protein